MSRLPAHRCSAPTSLTLCTSLLPSGVAITAEARKQLRGCFKTSRETLFLQLRGGQGAVPAHSPSTGHSSSPSASAQHLCRARGGRAQGQCVPKTCSTSGMRQQGREKEGLPSSGSSLPQCQPDPRRALLGAKAQPGQTGETLGQNTWEGRGDSRGAAVPTPSQHSGMARNWADEDAQAVWAKPEVPVWGTVMQRPGRS